MHDSRVSQFATILADWSLQLKQGDSLFIDSYSSSDPLAHELAAAAYRRGVRNVILYRIDETDWIQMMQKGTEQQIRDFYRDKAQKARPANKFALVEGMATPYPGRDIYGMRLKLAEELEAPFYSHVWSPENRSVITEFPSAGSAEEDGLALDEYVDAFYAMTLLDWKKESERIQRIAKLFRGVRQLKVEGDATDMVLSVEGYAPTIEDGRENMPGGEGYFGRMRQTLARGHISFDVPVVYAGRRIDWITLEFRDGYVTRVDAAINRDLLRHLLLGRHRGFLEEIGFGANRHATKRLSGFAEKTEGSIHIGVDNDAGTNIDFTTTPRRVGEYAGGKIVRTILENGSFRF